MNVVDYLLQHKPVSLDAPAVLTANRVYSYRDLYTGIDAMAAFLQASGAQKGERIMIIGENSFAWIVSYLATLRSGCVAVPISPGTKKESLEYVIDSCGISRAFLLGRINPAEIPLPEASTVVFDALGATLEGWLTFEFSKIVEGDHTTNIAYPEVDEAKDLAAIMFTSGSTGQPRGVMVSHRNIIANTESIVSYLDLTFRDRMMVVLPFYYCFGTSLLHTHLRAAGSLVLDSRFMFPDKVLVRMQETQCTGFAGVPSHYQILLRKSSLRTMRFPALRYVQQAGGKLANDFIRELQESVPSTKIYVMYGQTEATARLSYLPPELLTEKMGSIGKGLPGTRLAVVDDEGKPVAPGAIGEIVAVGDNIARGYWRSEGESASVFRDGCLRTGDLATIDDQGFIFIVDRAKDILKCGGNRVSCKEIEDRLLQYEGLVEAAVIGVPDEILGEAVKAFVVPEKKDDYSLDDLRGFCSRSLPQHLIPREIVVMEQLPKSSTGKIMKLALRSMN